MLHPFKWNSSATILFITKQRLYLFFCNCNTQNLVWKIVFHSILEIFYFILFWHLPYSIPKFPFHSFFHFIPCPANNLITQNTSLTYTGIDFEKGGGWGGGAPRVWHWRGWNKSCHLSFFESNTHLATRNLKFQAEIEPDCSEDLFFGLHMNLGAKFWTEIELFSLTKLRKNILPPRNLFNQQKIDAYLNTS